MKTIALLGIALLSLACGSRKHEGAQAAQHQPAKVAENSAHDSAAKAPTTHAHKRVQARKAIARADRAEPPCGPAWYPANRDAPLAVQASHEKECGR